MSISNRLSTLEQAGAVKQINLIVRYVSPGDLDAELWGLQHYSDEHPRQAWTRRPDETEQEFTERALSEAKRNSIGAAMLIQTDLEHDHAST